MTLGTQTVALWQAREVRWGGKPNFLTCSADIFLGAISALFIPEP